MTKTLRYNGGESCQDCKKESLVRSSTAVWELWEGKPKASRRYLQCSTHVFSMAPPWKREAA